MPESRPLRLPPPEVPTKVQLGLKPKTILVRGLFKQCPVCGSKDLFRHWLTMVERCPDCSFLFERVEGHWIGAIAVNTIAVIGLMMITLIATLIATYPNQIPLQLILVLLVIGGVGTFAYYPVSKTFWTAIDILMRPLKFGEVDPRFVEVDPLRDNPLDPSTPDLSQPPDPAAPDLSQPPDPAAPEISNPPKPEMPRPPSPPKPEMPDE